MSQAGVSRVDAEREYAVIDPPSASSTLARREADAFVRAGTAGMSDGTAVFPLCSSRPVRSSTPFRVRSVQIGGGLNNLRLPAENRSAHPLLSKIVGQLIHR